MYSIKFRKEVLKTLEQKGNSIRKVAMMFGIGSDTSSRWKKRGLSTINSNMLKDNRLKINKSLVVQANITNVIEIRE